MNIEMLSEKNRKILHLIIGCVCTVLIIALGIGFMVSCWDIYSSGPRAFSRESIGAALAHPAMVILMCSTALSCFLGFMAQLIVPTEKAKTKAIRDELMVMGKMSEKVGVPNEQQSRKIKFEKAIRTASWIAFGFVCLVLAIFPAAYLFNRSNFPGIDPTAEIKIAALITMPSAFIMLGCYFGADLITKYSAIRQTAVYKQMLLEKNLRAADPVKEETQSKGKVLTTVIRLAVIALALCFIVVGIFNGSANDVLTKAVKICTECIGLG